MMSAKRLLLCMGTRPEIIKMGPVYHALKAAGMQPVLLHTGQHEEMAWPLYEFFDMAPDHVVHLERERKSLGHVGGRMMDEIDRVMIETRTEAVLVHGDTTSALMGAMAAFQNRIPVGHVEAGLRSHDPMDPFPEEMNRTVIARIAHWHFAPTELAVQNLKRENVAWGRIFQVGNTVIDATHMAMARALEQYSPGGPRENCPAAPFVRKASGGRLVLVTLHRRENWGEPIERVARTIRHLVESEPDIHLVWPVHLNPIVRESVFRVMGSLAPEVQERVRLTVPLDYAQMLWILRHSWLVVTDSGGIQEEAAALGRPVLVARRTTERPELIQAGGGVLVGTDPEVIRSWVSALSADPSAYERMSSIENPYGDGRSGERIARILREQLEVREDKTDAAAA